MTYVSLAVFVAITLAVALSGAAFKPGDWYAGLDKPSWTPPNWAFPVVWTILYVMIAASGWMLWSAGGLTIGIVLWLLQAGLNGAWSWLFFGRQRMDLAMFDVAALWMVIALYIVFAWPISQLAAMLFVPYLVWVSAAAALNASVMRLNPGEGRGLSQ